MVEKTQLTAGQRVLGTPELLALILIHLDQRTLLTRAQRVCKTWRHGIYASPIIRRHLFIDISPTVPRGRPKDKVLNPLLAEVLPPWFQNQARERDFEEAKGLLKDTEASRQLQNSELWAANSLDNPFLRREATWMQMHISDPPTVSVALYRTQFVGHMREKTFLHPIYYPDGLRMLHLLLMTYPETTSPQDLLERFQVLWASAENSGVITEGNIWAAWDCAARRIGYEWPRRTWNDGPECFRNANGMRAELLVQKTKKYSSSPKNKPQSISSNTAVAAIQKIYEDCGLWYFAEEFAGEIRPYQHRELVLADAISSHGTTV